MVIKEKVFSFTKELEKNLETLLKIEKLTEDKRAQVEVNLKLVSCFNEMDFLSYQNEFKH